MCLCYPFLYPRLITNHSNIGVQSWSDQTKLVYLTTSWKITLKVKASNYYGLKFVIGGKCWNHITPLCNRAKFCVKPTWKRWVEYKVKDRDTLKFCNPCCNTSLTNACQNVHNHNVLNSNISQSSTFWLGTHIKTKLNYPFCPSFICTNYLRDISLFVSDANCFAFLIK